MRWIWMVVPIGVVVACDAGAPPAPKPKPLPEPLATLKRFRDEMCQCTTSECAQKVNDAINPLQQELARDPTPPRKMSDEELRQAKTLSDELGNCMQRAMAAKPAPAKRELPF